MAISYVDRGPVDDDDLSRVHDLAFTGSASGDTVPWSARLQAHSVGWVCAYVDGDLCGFVHACWDGGSHAFLLDTVVLPGLQRRGIGAELVRRLRDQVRQAGCEWLHVDYDPALEAFYRSCGFVATRAGLQHLT